MASLQTVAHAPYGADFQGAAHLPEPPADEIDVIIQISVLHRGIWTPDPGEKDLTGKGLSRVAKKGFLSLIHI